MAPQMQPQAIYPKRRLYGNEWQIPKAKRKWEFGMWLSAEARHKHRQALGKWLHQNCRPCEEGITGVVVMVSICHRIPGEG